MYYLYYNFPQVCLSVCVRKLRVAILARSSREMSLTVCIVWQYILSRVRVSVQPSNFFICEKHSKPRGNRAASASVYFNGQRPAIVTSGAGRHGWVAQCGGCGVCTRSRGCVYTAHTCASVRDAFAIYDNNIWPRLIMIIIKKYYSIFHTNQTHWWFPLNGSSQSNFPNIFVSRALCSELSDSLW